METQDSHLDEIYQCTLLEANPLINDEDMDTKSFTFHIWSGINTNVTSGNRECHQEILYLLEKSIHTSSIQFKLVKTTSDEAMPFMSPIHSLTLGTQAQILDQALSSASDISQGLGNIKIYPGATN